MNRLHAATRLDNQASQKVLLRNGFTIVGRTTLAERSGLLFAIDLRSQRLDVTFVTGPVLPTCEV